MPEDINDIIFPRLYCRTHYLVIESNSINLMTRLRDYAINKKGIAELNLDDFRMFNNHRNCLPIMSLIKRDFLPSDVLGTFLGSLGQKKWEEAIKAHQRGNVYVLMERKDNIVRLVHMGLYNEYLKWVSSKL